MRSMIRGRIVAVCLSMGAVAGGEALSLLAQEPAKVEKKAPSTSRRVPANFSKLGVTAEQKEKIYTIRGRHLEKIETLEREIEQIKTKELEECEAVLTEAQRKMLATIRDEAKGKGKATAPAAKKPAEK